MPKALALCGMALAIRETLISYRPHYVLTGLSLMAEGLAVAGAGRPSFRCWATAAAADAAAAAAAAASFC